MGYRDDRAALEHQLHLLEQELGPMREELQQLEEQRVFLAQEVARRRRSLRVRQLLALLVGRHGGGRR